jgi:hypothetical protein
MRAFLVALGPDEQTFLQVTDALAGKGVNLTAVAMLPGDPPQMGFTVDLEDAARLALRQAGVEADEYDVIDLHVANAPGTLALAAHALADAGVPIRLLLTVRATRGRATDVVAVDDAQRGRLILRGLSDDGLLD